MVIYQLIYVHGDGDDHNDDYEADADDDDYYRIEIA